MSSDRLSPQNAAFLSIDHQTGLANGIQDQSIPEFMTGVAALARTAKAYDLPAVITTSAANGPNGPILPVVADTLPDAKIIHRPGEINAFDNPEFATAVKETGRKKLIVAGISTEVCVAFAAIAALEAGYDAYAVIDASGTWNKLVQEVAIQRMVQAGVKPITWVAVAAELQSDWRSPTGQDLAAIMGEYLPFYGNLIGSFMASQKG